jgi:hypothetical protein
VIDFVGFNLSGLMASSQLQHVCQLSRTVVDGLVTRVRRIGDLLALVPDSAQLASQRAAVDTLTALRTVRTHSLTLSL